MERLSVSEREKLLHGLHGYLAWVGAEIPDVFEIGGTEIPLHEVVWRLVNKKELTKVETAGIESLIRALEEKETCDEDTLAKETITREEAEDLYKEASGLLRAIMDLKGIGDVAHHDKDIRRKILQKKISDARGLLKFVDEVV
ncbi:MAG: hypothetical protein C5S48_08575 [Candidatus Methanogaster sp.]|nr:MAG: hypothetical protein C5S48_08575 [ANME-2 cluster archaeon]